MNERIKQLTEQAIVSVDIVTGNEALDDELAKMYIPDCFAEKFAELMTKKFDDILVLEYLDCVGNKDKPAAERIERLREKVRTYFGVEE